MGLIPVRITREVDGGVITIGAVTTPPTKGTTSIDKVFWHREGQFLVATYRYRQTVAGSAGSGVYLFTLPNSLSVDTTIMPTTGGSTADGTDNISRGLPADVTIYSTTGPGAGFSYYVAMYSVTQFYVRYQQIGAATNDFIGSGTFPLSQLVGYRISIKIPIAGW